MSYETALYAAVRSAHARHGIEFIGQDETLEIVLSKSVHDEIAKAHPGMEGRRLDNFMCIPIRIDDDIDGFVVRKREGVR